jgi:hypothetical protein
VGVSSTNGDGVGAPGWVTPAIDFALVAVPVGVALGLIGLGVSFYADSQIDALYKPPR